MTSLASVVNNRFLLVKKQFPAQSMLLSNVKDVRKSHVLLISPLNLNPIIFLEILEEYRINFQFNKNALTYNYHKKQRLMPNPFTVCGRVFLQILLTFIFPNTRHIGVDLDTNVICASTYRSCPPAFSAQINILYLLHEITPATITKGLVHQNFNTNFIFNCSKTHLSQQNISLTLLFW